MNRLNAKLSRYAAATIIFPLVLSGCVAAKSYIDPAVPTVHYEELVRPAQPLKLDVSAEFLRNGDHIERSGKLLKEKVDRVLLATGVIDPTLGSRIGEIHVVLDSLEDRDMAAYKGVGRGLTFGPIGGSFQYAFEMSVTITVNGTTFTHEGLHHSVIKGDGSSAGPKGVTLTTLDAAVDKVIEQMLLAALKEFQRGNPPMAQGRAISVPRAGFCCNFQDWTAAGGHESGFSA